MAVNRSLWLQRLVGTLRDWLQTVVIGVVSAVAFCYGALQTGAIFWSLRPESPSEAGLGEGVFGQPVMPIPEIGTLVVLIVALACLGGGLVGVKYAIRHIETIGRDTPQSGGSENA